MMNPTWRNAQWTRYSKWASKHPQLARQFMYKVGMATVFDEARCPRCDEGFKAKGDVLESKHAKAYESHVRNHRCEFQAKEGRMLTMNEVYRRLHFDIEGFLVSAQMKDQSDPLWCHRCGRLYKKKGVELTGDDRRRYTMHMRVCTI